MLNIIATKYLSNPILTPRVENGSFERAAVYNPAAVVKDGKVYLLYRAEDNYYDDYISCVGLAISDDGFHFERHAGNPIITPEEEDETRGIEDLRIIETEQGYFLTYTGYSGRDAAGSRIVLSGAFSKDLIHWEKIGRLVPGREKAGAIVQDYKHQGKYAMYFGEGEVKIAFSEDLRNWNIQEKPALEPRKGFFDSRLVEGGPPPIVTDEGILMIYNSANKTFYQPGVALFDKQDPTRMLYRSDKPLLEPTEYWEMYGKVNAVIFTNGLVNFKDKWLLYYGGADKSIGVAVLSFI